MSDNAGRYLMKTRLENCETIVFVVMKTRLEKCETIVFVVR